MLSELRGVVGDCLREFQDIFLSVNQKPIMVFGSPKSGTTIIGYLLSEALDRSYTADIVRAISDSSMGFQLEHKILSVDAFVNKYKREFSSEIIKETVLTNYASSFIDYFKEGKFVFIIRDPRDNIRSILNRLNIPGDLSDIDMDVWPELVKTPAWRLVLDDSWRTNGKGGSYIEVLARNWMSAYEQYAANIGMVSMIKYENFNKNKVKEITALCARMGVDVKKDISSLVNVQKQGVGERDVDLVTFFGKVNLSKIERICADGIREMDYESILGRM